MGEAVISPRARWEQLLGVQNESNTFVIDLLKQLEFAQDEHAKTEDNLQQALEEKKSLYTKFRDAHLQLKNLHKEMDNNSFVSVLIDGDCMNFLDKFVTDFGSGGKAAAYALLSSVGSYVKGSLDLSHDPDVLIRVYCNVRGLSKTYVNNGILDSKQDFELFVHGFNKAHPFCDFVDVGEGKERADNKIREMFKVHIRDLHCKHVFLGGSSDNGYARVLEPYTGEEAFKNQITMLQGPPFAAELSALVDKFRVTSLPEVFRDKKMDSAPPMSVAGGLQPASSTYAKRAASANTTELELTPPKKSLEAVKPGAFTERILRNILGQRIDESLPHVSESASELMGRARLCNPYHLGLGCPFQKCDYVHGPKLYGEHLSARRLVARQSPCKKKDLDCADKHCFYGHRCPDDPHCTRPKCKFPAKMHNVDTKVVT